MSVIQSRKQIMMEKCLVMRLNILPYLAIINLWVKDLLQRSQKRNSLISGFVDKSDLNKKIAIAALATTNAESKSD